VGKKRKEPRVWTHYKTEVKCNCPVSSPKLQDAFIFSSIHMAAEQGDRFSSIEVPLLHDEKVYQVNDSNGLVSKNKDEYHMVHVGNASSFKTCFHLVNAISGSFLALSFLLPLIIKNYSNQFYIIILCS